MRHYPIAFGACLAALAIGAAPAFAQGSMSQDTTPSTYQAAQQAGASAQKVAPPNLVLPADMGGGTWGQRYGSGPTSTNGTTTAPSTTNSSGSGTGTGSMSPSGAGSGTSGTTNSTNNTTTSPNNTNTNPATTPSGTNTTSGGSGNTKY